jgi:nitrate/nitrite transporter NarK
MFILEGLPSFILGITTFFYLTDHPQDAKWLTPEEKAWLVGELQKERAEQSKQESKHSVMDGFRNRKVWILALIYITYITGALGIGYFMPQIIKGFSKILTNTQVGLLTMVPYVCAGVGMYLWGRRSDRTGERFLHASLPVFVSAAAIASISYFSDNLVLAMAMLVIATVGTYCFNGPYWAIPPKFVMGAEAAVGIAAINSVGNLGGFIGPYIMGYLKTATGGTSAGLFVMCGSMALSGVLILWMRHKYQSELEHEQAISRVSESALKL